ncbi:MAG: TrkA family potassium uptake protein [Eubacteriales bacterium]
MKSFLVIGMGRFGSSVAKELYALGHEVLVIDKSEENINEIADSVTHSIIGDAKDLSVLQSIGVRNFDSIVVAIAENLEDSILITLQLKELGAQQVTCKARNEPHAKVLSLIGADKVVMPEFDMGKRLAQHMSQTNIIDFIELSPDYSIMELPVPKCWINKTISELNVRNKFGVTVLAIQSHDGQAINSSPTADTQFNAGDKIVAVGSNTDLQSLCNLK